MKWYITCIKNYFNFTGRARRREYWVFVLINLTVILSLLFLSFYTEEEFGTDFPITIMFIYILFIIIPHFAVVVRRLHDINKSGVWWFIRFVPFIGPFWLLYLLCEDSWEGPNKWDINPKGIGNEDVIDQIGNE